MLAGAELQTTGRAKSLYPLGKATLVRWRRKAMPEIRTVTTLRRTRDEISASIRL